MKKVFIASTLLMSCIANQSMAETNAAAEVYLGAGQYFWDSDRNLDNSTSLEGGIEIPVDERLSFEAWLSDFDAEPDSGASDLDGTKYSLGGLYHLSNETIRPFVSLGASHQEFDASGVEADESLVYLGLGAKKYFDNNIVLRGEVLAMNSIDHEVWDYGVRVAVGYAFGADSKPAVEAAPRVVPKPEPMVKQEPPKAEEKVQEVVEQTEEVVSVKAPLAKDIVEIKDADLDGIADELDACPDTDSAYKVDSKGCPIELVETVTINIEVLFASNSAEVSGNEDEIKKLAEFLKQFEDTKVTVEGHTDDRGAAAYNKQLSQRRADAIRSQLISKYGIAESRVNAVGLGEEQPIASNDTAQGRAENRRVVARVSADAVRLETK